MIRIIRPVFIISILLLSSVEAQILGIPEAKVVLHVIDADGNPVSDAKVKVGFVENRYVYQFQPPNEKPFIGLTDKNGMVTAQGHTGDRLGCDISKSGYYFGWPPIKLDSSIAGKWQPWGATNDLILRKIINPIPMYARHIHVQVPTLDSRVGYDLEVGDWVAPYGKGQSADFIFTAHRDFTDRTNFNESITISFSNVGDGILHFPAPTNGMAGYGSELRFPYHAPTNGYETQLLLSYKQSPNAAPQRHPKDNSNFIFRVRSIKSDSQTVRSNYGKIDGEIIMIAAFTDRPGIDMTYYINPNNGDNNLEFNPSKNLSRNLSSDQEVKAP